MAVVTISRQYGAGGRHVAAAVARALGFRAVDRELVEEAARRIGMDPEVARSRDERVPALIEEVGLALASASPPFVGAPLPQLAPGLLDDRALAEATRTVIESLADAGGYVILGRGGQAALGDRPDAFHVALVADPKDRVRRVMDHEGLDEREARQRCRSVDAERAAYVRRYYGVDIRDPLLYDLVVNTSRLGLEGAAELVVAAARRKLRLA